MENIKPKRRAIVSLALVCAVLGLTATDAHAQTNSSGGSFLGGLFGGSSKPAPPPSDAGQAEDDSIALKNKKTPGVELYVAVAQLYTETGKYAEAEDQYRQAVKVEPNDIRVLLGYAMLKDQMNQPDEALKFYQQAEEKHAKQPAVYNNLAIHFIRRGMLPEAIEAAQHAVDLRPNEPRYRNNLAALLVEAGRPQEAFRQLRAVYDEPVAHYNLGFLLNKRGLKPGALQEFAIALQMNPNMAPARQWVERLSHEPVAGAPVGMMPQQRPAAPMVAPGPPNQRDYSPAAVAPLPPQYPMAGTLPAQAQYPVPPQYQMPQNQPPQYQPQYQIPSLAAPPANAVPLTASRDPNLPLPPPPPSDAGGASRLPPVNDPAASAPGTEQVAPDPPNWRR